jgi:putative polyketide hydroxylase
VRGGAYRAGTDFDGDVAGPYGIGTECAVLVRPDGFIAWRAQAADGDIGAALARALARDSP